MQNLAVSSKMQLSKYGAIHVALELKYFIVNLHRDAIKSPSLELVALASLGFLNRSIMGK